MKVPRKYDKTSNFCQLKPFQLCSKLIQAALFPAQKLSGNRGAVHGKAFMLLHGWPDRAPSMCKGTVACEAGVMCCNPIL